MTRSDEVAKDTENSNSSVALHNAAGDTSLAGNVTVDATGQATAAQASPPTDNNPRYTGPVTRSQTANVVASGPPPSLEETMHDDMSANESSDSDCSDADELGGTQLIRTRSERSKKTLRNCFLDLFQELRTKLLNGDYSSNCIRISLPGTEKRAVMYSIYPRRILALLIDIPSADSRSIG